MTTQAPAALLSVWEVRVLNRVCAVVDGATSVDAARDLGMTTHELARTVRRIPRSLGVSTTAAALSLVGPVG